MNFVLVSSYIKKDEDPEENVYPQCRIDDTLGCLKCSHFFSSIGIKSVTIKHKVLLEKT